MIDKQAIHDGLVEAFMTYQYRLDNPMPLPTETHETIVLQYQGDRIFNRKVNSLASGVMHVLESHLVKYEKEQDERD